MSSDYCLQLDLFDRIHDFVVANASGELTADHWTKFEQLLQESDEACRLYLQYVETSDLLPSILNTIVDEDSASPTCYPTFHSSLLSTAIHGTIGFFSQELPFSLLIGTVLTGLGLWFASMVYVSSPDKIARDSSSLPSKTIYDPTMDVVGKITGMADCKWADRQTETFNGANVLFGRKYALASGAMEITYDTGAKVILQGPVVYEVDSRDGGFLSIGKLTAKLEKKGSGVRGQGSGEVASGQPLVVSGQWPVASRESSGVRVQDTEAVNQKSEIRNQKSLAPVFVVRTPTATVTDLGTEFGVEVHESGQTEAAVFTGSVEMSHLSSAGKVKPIIVRAGETGRLAGGEAIAVRKSDLGDRQRFVRSLARQSSNMLAHLRADCDRRGPENQDGNLGRIPDHNGNGVWEFYSSHTENPTSLRADLQPLTFSATGDLPRAVGAYIARNQPFGFPAIKNGKLALDLEGRIEGTPTSDAVAIHPGESHSERPYLVIRWKVGPDEAGPIRIMGRVRVLAMGGNGITFASYVNGTAIVASREVRNYDGYRWNIPLSVSAGNNIDFVVGNNEDWSYDQSSLAVEIVKASTGMETKQGTRIE